MRLARARGGGVLNPRGRECAAVATLVWAVWGDRWVRQASRQAGYGQDMVANRGGKIWGNVRNVEMWFGGLGSCDLYPP